MNTVPRLDAKTRAMLNAQRERMKTFRCGTCGKPAVPNHHPHAVPMCAVHGSRNMLEWTDEYRYCESYLCTVARAQGPEELDEWVADVELTEWTGVTRPGLRSVLELLRFWGMVPAKLERGPILLYGRKAPIAMYDACERCGFVAVTDIHGHAYCGPCADLCADAEEMVTEFENAPAEGPSWSAGQGDVRAERAPGRDTRQSGATPDAGHRHNLHQRGCSPEKRPGCECAFPYCPACATSGAA